MRRMNSAWWLLPALLIGGALWVAMIRAALADEIRMWGPTAYVQIQPTDKPGAVAQVAFHNDTFHTQFVEQFPLTLDGLTVAVRIDAQLSMEPETMTVTPPPGFIAIPESVTVQEGEMGVVYIFEDAIG